MLLQSNVSIADMLYNGHVVIADTFLKEMAKSRSNSHRKTSLLDSFIVDICYSFFEHRVTS